MDDGVMGTVTVYRNSSSDRLMFGIEMINLIVFILSLHLLLHLLRPLPVLPLLFSPNLLHRSIHSSAQPIIQSSIPHLCPPNKQNFQSFTCTVPRVRCFHREHCSLRKRMKSIQRGFCTSSTRADTSFYYLILPPAYIPEICVVLYVVVNHL